MTEDGKTFCDSCRTMDGVKHYDGVRSHGDRPLRLDLCEQCARQCRGLINEVEEGRQSDGQHNNV